MRFTTDSYVNATSITALYLVFGINSSASVIFSVLQYFRLVELAWDFGIVAAGLWASTLVSTFSKVEQIVWEFLQTKNHSPVSKRRPTLEVE